MPSQFGQPSFGAAFNYLNATWEETMFVASLTTNLSTLQVSNLNTCLAFLFPQTELRIALGTSMLNPANQGGYSTYTNTCCEPGRNLEAAWPNSLAQIYQAAHPNDLIIDYASPGSQLANLCNQPTLTGSTNFNLGIAANFLKAGKKVIIGTDGARNDVSPAGGSGAMDPFTAYNLTSMVFSNWIATYSPGANGGQLEIHFLADPLPAAAQSNPTCESNLWVYGHMMRTNPFIYQGLGGYVDLVNVLTTNDVGNWTYGSAHLDMPAAWMLEVQESAHLFNYDTSAWYNPTNPAEPWIYGANVGPPTDGIHLHKFLSNWP
jgi:hypothetical protein